MSRDKGFRLRTFGGLALLDRENGAPLATVQRKRLVLLALLAAAGKAGLSRELLLAYMWPESDSDRARQSLKQAVYSLRLAIGDEALVLGPTEIRLDAALLPSDVDDFERALGAGEWMEADVLYGGLFLEGVHLSDSPELERWIDRERQRLAVAHAGALEKLARQAAGSGAHAEAVGWWRRLAVLDPASSRITLELMRALSAAGDAPAAIRQARLHEALLRQDFDTAPDPAVLELVERLRATSTAAASVAHQACESPGTDADAPEAVGASPPHRTVSSAAEPLGSPGWRLRRVMFTAAMLLAVTVAVAVATRAAAVVDDAAPGDPNTIAVLPFTVRGTGDLDFLAEGMVDLLGTNLDGAGDLRAVDPRALLGYLESGWNEDADELEQASATARRFGAGRYVLGSVTGTEHELRLSAVLYEVGRSSQPVVRSTAHGTHEELFDLVDRVTVQLLADLPGGPDTRLARTAAITTTSLEALKAYLTGESYFRRAQYADAIEAFQAAVALDSGFALANYRLSRAADHGNRIDLARLAAERAVRDTGRLGTNDRLLVAAMAAQRQGAMDDAELIYRHIVSRSPTDVESWYHLGEVLFHGNGPRGRSFLEARAAYERVLALTPHDRDAVSHLARIAAAEGDRLAFDSLLASPAGQRDVDMRVLRAFTFGGQLDQNRVLALLDTADDQAVHNHCWRVAVYGRKVREATVICRLLTDPHRPPETRALGHQRLAELALAQGRIREARRELGALSQLLPEWGAELMAFYTHVPLIPDDPTGMRGVRDWLLQLDFEAAPERASLHFSHLNGKHEHVRRYLIGFLGAALEGMPEAEEGPADSPGGRLATNVSLSLAAYREARSGRASSALALLDSTGGDRHTGDLWYGAIIHDRYLRAELLQRLGRIDEAAAWYGSIGEPQVMDLAYAGQGAYMSARLHDQRGRSREASLHYRRFIDLWAACDPELRRLVDQARQRVRVLEQAAADDAAGPTG